MGAKIWTINTLLKVTADYLKEKEIESPRLSAEILLACLLNTDRVDLYLRFDQPLSGEEIDQYRSLVKRRLNREPIQYITGTQEFWSMAFLVNPHVLIPRPESEILIERATALCREGKIPEGTEPRVLDLGTGSGVLAVAFSKEIPNASVWASDISGDALDVALKNAERHGLKGRIGFVQGDLLEPFRQTSPPFDLVLSNPPYIPSETLKSLSPEIRDHEPRQALDGQEDGMFYIREIIEEGPGVLRPGGWLLMEMDPDQTEKALGLIEASRAFADKMRVRDYSHRYRVVMARTKAGAVAQSAAGFPSGTSSSLT